MTTFTAITGAYGKQDLLEDLGQEEFNLWIKHDGEEVEVIDHNEIDGYCDLKFKDGFEISMCSELCIE